MDVRRFSSYNTNTMPDLVPLFFEKYDIALISKWRTKIEPFLSKIHRSMYIEYKDPYRRMLKGGLFVESMEKTGKGKKRINFEGKKTQKSFAAGPRRRRDSQRSVNPVKGSKRKTKVQATVDSPKPSILDLINP
jgi:hypothetical protein